MSKIAFVGNSLQTMCNFRMGVISSLSQLGHEIVVIAPEDCNHRLLQISNVRFIPIEIDCKGMNPFIDLRLVQSLKKVYLKEHFDLIFHYTIKPVIYGGWAAARTRSQHIAVITGLGYTFLRKGWINRISKFLYSCSLRNAKEVWFLNQDDKTLFVEQNIVSLFKTRVLNGEGVDTTFYQSSQAPTSPFTFLFIGRVLWDKGIGEFVDAARVVKKQHPNVQFHILGQLGASNPACVNLQQMEEWEKSGVVKFLGETQDVRPYINETSCIVLPSYREGISRVLLEAASMQRPIITTNVPGCKEIVLDGVSGFLCEAQEVNSLIACMMHMLSLSDHERLLFGQQGREHILQNYDQQIIIQRYKDKLSELL